ncbi:hypothetical protein AN958_08366 [Leucoagaricus sp. SymC.cos]|nr:hypothetical protein AN958_08366 [Leucoagaricus sp. SymC.cos]
MNFRTTALSCLTRVQAGLSHTELVHIPHSLWPFPHRYSASVPLNNDLQRPLRISILDASFNPPTLAHLALINASRPSDSSTSIDAEESDYDARLLLLSVKNVDKTLKSTDATYVQRLEMMHHLTQYIHCKSSPSAPVPSASPAPDQIANMAIGIINEPTFVGKSTVLLAFLQNRVTEFSTSLFPNSSATTSNTAHDVHFELSFNVGMDTLERLVAPRYYASEEAMTASLRHFLSPLEENSLVICARRNLTSSPSSSTAVKVGDGTTADADANDALKPAREFIETGRIKLIDIGADESTYSSTAVRTMAKKLGLDEDGRKAWGRFVVPSIEDYIVSEGLYVE